MSKNRKILYLSLFGLFVILYAVNYDEIKKRDAEAKAAKAEIKAQKLAEKEQNLADIQKAKELKQQEATKITFYEDSCLAVINLFGPKSTLTGYQREQLWDQKYKGKVFKWQLRVTDISSKVFSGGLHLQAACVGSDSLIQDIVISYKKDARPLFQSVQRGQTVTAKGILKYQGELIGLNADGIAD